jgi:hypothetical protein
MIIKYDFCKKHNLIIDTKTTQLHFDTDPPSDYRQLLNKGKVHLLTLLTKYDIPAFSETNIDVKVKTASHGKFLLNSLAHLTMRYGVAVAKGVIEVHHQKATVILANLSSEPVTLPEGFYCMLAKQSNLMVANGI